MSAFPDEIYQAPRSWAEQAYPKLIHYNKLDKGGHFAAWEQPELFMAEMRAASRSLRNRSEERRRAQGARPPSKSVQPAEQQEESMPEKSSLPRRSVLAASRPHSVSPSLPDRASLLQRPTTPQSVRSTFTFRKRRSPISAGASPPRGGPTRRPSRIGRRASSSRNSRSSSATGAPTTTGARWRRG